MSMLSCVTDGSVIKSKSSRTVITATLRFRKKSVQRKTLRTALWGKTLLFQLFYRGKDKSTPSPSKWCKAHHIKWSGVNIFINRIYTNNLVENSNFHSPLTLTQSFLKNSRACGWSCSTDWETSMTYTLPLWYLRARQRTIGYFHFLRFSFKKFYLKKKGIN